MNHLRGLFLLTAMQGYIIKSGNRIEDLDIEISARTTPVMAAQPLT